MTDRTTVRPDSGGTLAERRVSADDGLPIGVELRLPMHDLPGDSEAAEQVTDGENSKPLTQLVPIDTD